MDNSIIRLPKNRNLFFSKQVDQSSIGKLTEDIIEINEDDQFLIKQAKLYGFEYSPKPIKLYIDSYGGHAYQIMGLISVMERSKTPIHTICTGAAMSCGFLMLITGHRRFCYEYSTPLYHQISSGSVGELKHIEERVDETKRLQLQMEKIVLEKTKISKKKLKEIYTTKFDWFMSSEEALKLGVVDEIL